MSGIGLLDKAGRNAATGIKLSESQWNRNAKNGDAPAAIKIGSRNAWVADEIEAFKRAQIAKRNHPWLKGDLTSWIRKQVRLGNNPWADGKIDVWVSSRLKERGEGKGARQ